MLLKNEICLIWAASNKKILILNLLECSKTLFNGGVDTLPVHKFSHTSYFLQKLSKAVKKHTFVLFAVINETDKTVASWCHRYKFCLAYLFTL